MLSSIGPTGFILLAVIALLLFGPNKLPELGRAVGRTFREFKEGAREIISEDDSSNRKEQEKSKPLAVDSEPESAPKPVDKRLPE
ncbi:twin-arginine translocase TatA/TatE family subunit [Paenibacillus sp. 7516]|uniref:twin-arginine translocase TatA/TatE family subunit n=1 Tax=Paenibacillus sp. 7516 TaxID=2022549 RepID=UPI000BA5F810|nr:twin-arginine translocase TatA/TatE family subunit [Paenibacillus sp. 7516]PAF31595.1 twin-arginine translocase TatA/TatE family subunit [Paenibacillus sp. 7516]